MNKGCGDTIFVYNNEYYICGKKYSGSVWLCNTCKLEVKIRQKSKSFLNKNIRPLISEEDWKEVADNLSDAMWKCVFKTLK